MNIIYLLLFKIYTWRYLSLKEGDDEQSKFAAKSNNLDKGKKQLKKSFFK